MEVWGGGAGAERIFQNMKSMQREARKEVCGEKLANY